MRFSYTVETGPGITVVLGDRDHAAEILRQGVRVRVTGFPGNLSIDVQGRHAISGECLVDTGGCGRGPVRNVVSNRLAAVLAEASSLAADAETAAGEKKLCGAQVTDAAPAYPGAPLEWICEVGRGVKHDEHEAYSPDGTIVRTWPFKSAS